MSRTAIVAIVDPNTVIRRRIKDMLSESAAEVYELNSPNELVSFIVEKQYKINLVITDIEQGPGTDFSGIDVLRIIRNRSTSIPVMILTSDSRREIIAKCVHEGASEYTLKPFDDAFLKTKIMKFLDSETLQDTSIIRFNLSDYLNEEIYKANKGSYAFALVKISYIQKDDKENASDNNFYRIAEYLFKELKSVFWDGDVLIHHGFQGQLGFFPFCGSENIKFLINKITNQFLHLKSVENTLANFDIKLNYVIYPAHANNVKELLNRLSDELIVISRVDENRIS